MIRKNIVSLALTTVALSVLIIASSTSVFASGTITDSGYFGEDGVILSWTLYDDGLLEISGEGPMPSSYSNPWKGYKDDIKSVRINEGIESISMYAFDKCTNLTSVILPNTLKTIGESAFEMCSSLKNISLPSSLTSIGKSAFSQSGLISIAIPDGIDEIPSCFYCCTDLKEVSLPDSITDINGSFSGCTSLKSLTIPDGVTRLAGCFAGSGLEEITIPASVTIIDAYTFYECSNLKKVEFAPSSKLTKMRELIFLKCDSLENIELPEGLTTIYTTTFYNCPKLENVYVPDSVKYIYDDQNDDNVAFVPLCPKAVVICSEDSFIYSYIKPLKIKYDFTSGHQVKSWSVTSEPTCTSEGTRHGVCITCYRGVTETIPANGHSFAEEYTIDREPTCAKEGSKSRHCANCDETTDVTAIPKIAHIYGNWKLRQEATCTEKGINERECAVCGFIDTEDIPAKGHTWNEDYTIDKKATCVEDGSKSIHCSVCNAIDEDSVITIPKVDHGICGINGDNVTWSVTADGILTISGIGEMANYEVSGDNCSPWNGVDGIKKVIIEDGVTKVGEFSFYHSTGISEAVIPNSVTSIEKCAFDGCTSLKEINLPDSISSLGAGAFENSGIESFTVPANMTEIPNSLFYGGSIKTISLHSRVNSIGRNAFYFSSLQEIDIPDSVTAIGDTAFAWSGIQSIKLPNTIDAISPSMFLRCTKLKSITIPNNVKKIDYGAFWDCTSLEKVVIPDGLTTIGNNAFFRCSKLKDINIPDSITDIGSDAFNGCTSLDTIVLSRNITSIHRSTFCECTNLKKVIIPDSVTSIEELAFYNCQKLTALTIPESVDSISNNAFDWAGLNRVYVVKDSYADRWVGTKYNKQYVYKDGEHYLYDTITKQPTCSEFGQVVKTCSACGEIRNEQIPKLEHNYSNWKVVKEATCEVDGSKERICSTCGYKDTEVIKAIGHQWSGDYTVDKEPSCTEPGSKSIHCTKCDAVTEETVIPALGHTFGDWVEVTPSTCENEGLRQHTCEVCGTVESENLDPNGHDFEEEFTVDVAATCTQDGSQSRHCRNCEAVLDSQVIPAIGHSWEEPVYTWEEDNSSVTATRICENDKTHQETETVATTVNETQPTYDAEGSIVYSAVFVNGAFAEQTKEIIIPKLDPVGKKGTDGTALGPGASEEAAEAAITGMKNDKDPAGSVFGLLQLRSTKQTNKSVTLKWKKVSGAVKYIIYGNKCGTANHMVKQKVVKKTSYNATKVVGNNSKAAKVKKGTYYKFIIVAVDKNGDVLSSSKVVHASTKGGKVGNDKKVTTKAKKNRVTLKKGQKFKLAAKAVPVSRKLKVKRHRAIAYETSDKTIATVNKKGQIKGMKKGTCYVYAYAQDGIFASIRVTVK